jgi:hypothetical protein
MRALGRILALGFGAMLTSSQAAAQSVIAEADLSVGHSTDGASAAATQVRLFGPIERSAWQMFAEVAWGGIWSSTTSDAFTSAYPYDRRVRPIETYVERTFRPQGALISVRPGRYRTPFGISGRSDHAYSGFVRAPLIRYGTNWALSNEFLETGVDVIAGMPSLYAEASVGVPQDAGDDHRRRGVDTVLRTQAFFHSVIAGASYLRTQPSMVGEFVQGRMTFSGVDARWMRGGVELRGEWVDGHPFDGVRTRGGYLDAVVHEPGMGPVTAVARVERLDYFAGPFSAFYRRVTVGGRVRISPAIGVQVNVLHQPRRPEGTPATAFDAGLTYSIRF